MSAEDELGAPGERPLPGEVDAADLASFWDDSESDDANIRIIRWWLRYYGRCDSEA